MLTDGSIQYWQRQCPGCYATLEKYEEACAWKCWRCEWNTEDKAHGWKWNGVSQKPGERTGEHL